MSISFTQVELAPAPLARSLTKLLVNYLLRTTENNIIDRHHIDTLSFIG